MKSTFAFAILLLAAAAGMAADQPVSIASSAHSGVYVAPLGGCAGTIIYDTTHASNLGAELAPTANGPATSLADLIVLGGTDRFLCEITVEVFTLNDNSPFDLTLDVYTDCVTNGAGNSPCGNGPGVLIPAATSTVTGIQAPALGTIFSVSFNFPLVNLGTEVDNTIAVSMHPSRNNVLWRIDVTPVVGAVPAGEPAGSVVERCGSVGANNGCARNFGVQNNFAMTIEAMTTPVSLMGFEVD